MQPLFLVAAVLCCFGALASAVRAETSADFVNPNAVYYGRAEAKRLIELCWEASKKRRNDLTNAGAVEGAAQTYKCLNRTILDLTEKLFDTDTLSRAQMTERLAQLEEAHVRFYDDLYSNNLSCFCGTMNYGVGNFMHVELLEKMIYEMLHVYMDPEFSDRIEYYKKTSK